MPEITWTGHRSSELGGLHAVTVPGRRGWIWAIYRDGQIARDSLTDTGDEWGTEAEAQSAAGDELRRLASMKVEW